MITTSAYRRHKSYLIIFFESVAALHVLGIDCCHQISRVWRQVRMFFFQYFHHTANGGALFYVHLDFIFTHNIAVSSKEFRLDLQSAPPIMVYVYPNYRKITRSSRAEYE